MAERASKLSNVPFMELKDTKANDRLANQVLDQLLENPRYNGTIKRYKSGKLVVRIEDKHSELRLNASYKESKKSNDLYEAIVKDLEEKKVLVDSCFNKSKEVVLINETLKAGAEAQRKEIRERLSALASVIQKMERSWFIRTFAGDYLAKLKEAI